jgi:hypothetical protein
MPGEKKPVSTVCGIAGQSLNAEMGTETRTDTDHDCCERRRACTIIDEGGLSFIRRCHLFFVFPIGILYTNENGEA